MLMKLTSKPFHKNLYSRKKLFNFLLEQAFLRNKKIPRSFFSNGKHSRKTVIFTSNKQTLNFCIELSLKIYFKLTSKFPYEYQKIPCKHFKIIFL